MINYNEWHQQHYTEDDVSSPWHRFVKEEIKHLNFNNKLILDIGCGRGGFSNYLAQHKSTLQKIVAADYSDSAIAIARNKYPSPKIEWLQQDIMAINFPDNYFDTIISCETIEHVSDPRKALTELYRVLKPGGTLFLTCPNYFNLFGLWCLYRWTIGKPFTEGGQPYVNYILFPSVYYWLKCIGFQLEHVHSSEITIPARIPIHYYQDKSPALLTPFGYRTYYILKKF
jgi:SAM-dependent methyltransferase